MIGQVGTGPKHFLIDTDLATSHTTAAGAVAVHDGLIVGVSGVLSAPQALRGDVRFDHLVETYRAKGPVGLTQHHGQFSAAIVDAARQQVTLVHDILGLGRCYRWRRGDRVVAASDLALLAAHVGEHHRADLDADVGYVAALFLRNAPPPGRTCLSEIGELTHGISELHGPGGSSAKMRPWRPSERMLSVTASAAEKLLAGHVDAALDAVLDREAPMLADVSGGLDSTTVVATAAALGADVEAVTYTAARELTGGDTTFAPRVVDHFGFPWHRIDSDSAPIATVRRTIVDGEPGSAFHIHALKQLEAIVAASGSRSYLTGNVGDVIFGYGGLPRVQLADPILGCQPVRALRLARGEAINDGGRRTAVHMLRMDGMRYARAHRERGSIISLLYSDPPPWVAPGLVASLVWPAQLVDGLALRRPSSQYLWESVYEMARAEQEPFERRLDVDVLSPLYHLPLVALLLALPHELRRGIVGDRLLQRRALADRLPGDVARRTTKGSSGRLVGLQITESDAWYEAMRDDPALVRRGWVLADAWYREVDRARVGAAEYGPGFFWAMETEMWLRSADEHGWPAAVQVTEPR